jgi:mannitol-1-phosphate 5-dehydrogenase
MPLTGDRTFLGFGFGAIQAGLFLLEAFHSGAFRRLVVAEVAGEVVSALRANGGLFGVNIAHPGKIGRETLGPVEAGDPADGASRERLVAAVEEAAEIATAIPSVRYYASSGPGSLHRILAEGLARRSRAGGGPVVIYAAENHNRAAEILEEAVLSEVVEGDRAGVRRRARFLNTVIGKMSGIVTDPAEVRSRGLLPVTPSLERAFLVEAFNRILVSAVRPGAGDPLWEGYRRGLDVFEEKPDLLPFEEAKLYGHNAVHAAAAYLGALWGCSRIHELRQFPGAMEFLRALFVEESGAALASKHRGLDPLFTAQGFAAYADDLLDRMTNPHLGDTVERVGRDVLRKLGWDDRLVGTMRLVLAAGFRPRRFAFATAAALAGCGGGPGPVGPRLLEIWGGTATPGPERDRVLLEVEEGQRTLARWIAGGRGDIERLMRVEGPLGTM